MAESIQEVQPLNGRLVHGLLARSQNGKRILGMHWNAAVLGPDKIVQSSLHPNYRSVWVAQLFGANPEKDGEGPVALDKAIKRGKAPQIFLVSLGEIALVTSCMGYSEYGMVEVPPVTEDSSLEIQMLDESLFNEDKRIDTGMLLNRHLVYVNQVGIDQDAPLNEAEAEDIFREMLARAQATTPTQQ